MCQENLGPLQYSDYLLRSYMTGNTGESSIICKNFFSFRSDCNCTKVSCKSQAIVAPSECKNHAYRRQRVIDIAVVKYQAPHTHGKNFIEIHVGNATKKTHFVKFHKLISSEALRLKWWSEISVSIVHC